VAERLRSAAARQQRAGRGVTQQKVPEVRYSLPVEESVSPAPAEEEFPRRPAVRIPLPEAPEQKAEGSILREVEEARRRAETEAILSALNACLWNRRRAAVMLNIDYKALLYKMRKLGIGDKERTAVY
jgi:DNA-binding NtrC family response regulator